VGEAADLGRAFAGHRALRAVIEAGVEGRQGRMHRREQAARLDLGCYAVLAGDATCAGAAELLRTIEAPCEILVPEEQLWRDRLHETFGTRLEDRPMRCFSPASLDVGHLRILEEPPAGFGIARFDRELAMQLSDDLAPHALQAYGSVESFVTDGIGFAVMHSGRVVAAATSYAASSRRVEIAISTHPDYRRRGLARNASARLLVEVIAGGRSPEWSASNPVSKKLALGLGYKPGALCDIAMLRE
jgi:hypothetical protein